MRVSGLFGWVEYNNTRSLALLLGFVLLIQPLAAISLLLPLIYTDPAHAPWYHWGGYAAHYVPAITLAAAALFAIQMWWHVKTVRKAVAFRFVDNADEPRLCALVEPLCIAAGIFTPYVGVIDSPAMNAFACGVTARTSVIVFTRGIIDGLDDDELVSVIAHELMHIRNGDARLIAAANVFLRNLALLDRSSGWKPRRYRQVAALLFLPALFPVYLGVALLSQLCLRLGFASRLLISSAREFIADAEAVRLTQHPAAFVSAMQRIQGNSVISGLPPEQDAMMFDGVTQGRLATHPRIMDRIQAIVATTGQMALDARPRRDTRGPSVLRPGGFGPAGLVAQNMAALERQAVTGAVPRGSTLRAFRDVGNDRLVLGLRWDLAVAMVATFLTAMTIHRGDMSGVLGQMSHLFGAPGADIAVLFDKVRACQMAELKALAGAKMHAGACEDMMPAFASAAKKFGFNVMHDGRVLSDTEMSMLSPQELDGPAGMQSLPQGGFMIPGHAGPPRAAGPTTDLMPSYPVAVHDAWLHLVQGSIAGFLRARQCGILVHAHVSSATDAWVTWSITSETVEQIRMTATFAADGAQATRVKLDIADLEKTVPLLDSRKPREPAYPVAMRPALSPPLRPYFAEAVNAMMESRPFQAGRVVPPPALEQGVRDTADICASQRSRLASGTWFSIHDGLDRQ
jgi:Zn-dependent protease with chaperone function